MFSHQFGECLAQGSYDLTTLDERIIENRIPKEVIEGVIQDFHKTDHWIPAFPLDGRSSYGTFIVSILAIWLIVMMLLGATHKVLTASGALVCGGALLLAYVCSWGISYWVNSPISDTYLTEREREFNKIVDEFNKKNDAKDYKLEVGRYGAYVILRFNTPIKALGNFLMHSKRLQERDKEREKLKDQKTNTLQKEEDLL